jgi:hypothetical protein
VGEEISGAGVSSLNAQPEEARRTALADEHGGSFENPKPKRADRL